MSEQIAADAETAREEGDAEWADTLEAMAPTVVPSPDQIDTYVDKQLTEEEEAAWNDLFEVVSAPEQRLA